MICATELLPHQVPAVEKLEGLRVGALLMDMGMGKSRCGIELVSRRLEKISRVVWFCPVSLKETIEYELRKHIVPGTWHSTVHVFDEKTRRGSMPMAFWYVVGIESMSSSLRVISSVKGLIDERACIILDESSYIKGHGSARTWWITSISEPARYRLILNGTPISQGVEDLYAQYRFLSPQILGYRSFYSFAANHLEYSERFPGMVVRGLHTDVLAAKVAPYTYQVRKEDCLELPEKLYETRYFSMTERQRALYEQAKWELLDSITLEEFDSIAIFRLFTALQQITCGFWRRREPRLPGRPVNPLEQLEVTHHRLDTLIDVLSRIPTGQRVIIWAKFDYDIQGIDARLTAAHGSGCTALFYGRNKSTRHQDLERWRAGASPFLIATPGTGGHGHTFNEAAWAVFYNDGFKYSQRIQAEDRNHRIGQQHRPTYISLICRDSIDQRIHAALAKKENVVHAFRNEVDRVKDKRGMKALFNEL